ncbi:MAG: hypothetical protein GEV03_23920 [Streptosporangiales bacterium]|nr:hypothetical protein [Streptosporangiales bacterium]
MRAYDPLGDGGENSGEASLTVDDDPETAWRTERYTTADLGRLKRGVGLLVDLGRPRAVSRVDVLFGTGGGASLQLRAGNTVSLSGLSTVGTANNASYGVTLHPPPGTKARYWLVWFTRLPSAGGVYRGEVAALALSG